MSAVARQRWFDNYIELCLERISDDISNIRDMAGLRRLFHRLASQTGQVLNMTSAGAAAELKQKTAHNYTGLLESSFLIQRIPAWGTTLRARATRLPKLHVVDSGVAARLLGLSSDRLAGRDPTALQQFGHLLETFAVGEILKQASWMDHTPTVGHWRTRGRARSRPGGGTTRRCRRSVRNQGSRRMAGPERTRSADPARRTRNPIQGRRRFPYRRVGHVPPRPDLCTTH